MVAGLLVGVKQIMPENDVTLFGYVKFRAKVSGTCPAVLRRISGMFNQGQAGHDGILTITLDLLMQHLPGIFLCTTVPAAIVFGNPIKTVPFVVFGTYLAWLYLRFFQSKPELALQ